MNWDKVFDFLTGEGTFKRLVTLLLIAGFGVVYLHNPDDATLKGAVMAAFGAAWGYWLGSSVRSTPPPPGDGKA